MNISEILLDVLKREQKLEVQEFGVFTLQNSRAKLNSKNQSILPPAKEIVFSENFQLENPLLFPTLSNRMGTSEEQARFSLKTQTDFWKKKISVGQDFEISPFGKFIRENEQLVFVGNRVEVSTPDFYGLEEISFGDINQQKNKFESPVKKSDYRFSKSALWILLFAIPVAGLIYLSINHPEYVFGKKSFNGAENKNVTQKLKKTISKPQNQKASSDTLKTDSVSVKSTQP